MGDKSIFRKTKRCVCKPMAALKQADYYENYLSGDFLDDTRREFRLYQLDTNRLFGISVLATPPLIVKAAFRYPEKFGTMLHRVDGCDEALHRVMELFTDYPLVGQIPIHDVHLVNEPPNEYVNYMTQINTNRVIKLLKHTKVFYSQTPNFLSNSNLF